MSGGRAGDGPRASAKMGGVADLPSAPTPPPVFAQPAVAITERDDEIRAFLEDAEIPPLLPALAYLTGDLTLLRPELRPDPMLLAMPQGGLTVDQQERAREIALDALIRYRDGGCRPAPLPSEDDLVAIMEYTVGGTPMREYVPLLEEELALRGEDRRAPQWRAADLAPGVDFRVAIVGAGMSGLLAAHRLQQAGVPFVIYEKNDDVGGTWYENQYPGCRVDNPNHNYSYSFAQRHDWPLHFSTQDVLLGYFRQCADAFGLRAHIQFATEVVSATWSEERARWSVRVQHADGREETSEFNAIVSAVGQLNRPSYPDIAGRDTFAGPSFHSAKWDHNVDLRGKRVVVIGTGASAVQFIPEIAPVAGHVTVLQRTPPWLGPTPEYHEPVAPGLQWLYTHVPSYSEWNRFFIFWKMGDAVLPNVRVDPDWEPKTQSVSAANDLVRMLFAEYLKAEFTGRPDLLEQVMPDYPPGAKRILRDNGIWARTLTRNNVRLVTTPIREITADAVVTADGERHEADVVIYGTGFQASRFLTPMKVVGRGGIDIHDQWGGDARAYLGVTVPGFPNLFCLYGPNTNIVINGSIIYFSECGVRYIVGLVELVLRQRARAVDIRKDVHDEFNEHVDAENRAMAWGWSGVNSWYKNDQGRVSQNWPFSLLEYWRRTLAPNPDEYDVVP